MRILDYIEYTVSPEVKIGTCLLLLGAIIVVYLWEPMRRRRSKPAEKGIMRQVEVDPVEYSQKVNGWYKKSTKGLSTENNRTLVQLQHYVKELQQEKIHNLDDV